jgi:hypothetical protein
MLTTVGGGAAGAKHDPCSDGSKRRSGSETLRQAPKIVDRFSHNYWQIAITQVIDLRWRQIAGHNGGYVVLNGKS